MASAIIPLVGTETRLAGELRQFIAQLGAVRAKAASLKAIADMAASGGDWPGMCAAFGFSGASASADAEAVYNLLGSVNATLSTDASIAQILARMG